jgi:hypothetical protein
MAKTFYGYVERDLTKDPDWAAVTSKITSDIEKISNERQELRDSIEKQTLETQDLFNTYDQGANQTLNEALQQGSGQATDYMLQQYKLLKNGDINYRDYLSSMQVQQDDWKNLQTVSTEWNTKYDEYLKGIEDGTLSRLSQDSGKFIESFGNINNKAFIVNRSNGRLYVATKNPDGSINNDPDSFKTVAAIGNILNDKVNVLDVNTKTTEASTQLGRFVQASGRTSLEDVRNMPDYQKAEDNLIKGMLVTDRNKASVLLDYLKGYNTTRDPKAVDANTILLEQDENGLFQPKLTEEQEQAAYDAVKENLRAKLDHIESTSPPPVRNFDQGAQDAADRKRIQAETLNNVAQLWSGNESEKRNAANYLRSMNDDILRIDVKPEGVYVTYKEDGRREPMKFEGYTGNDWVTGFTNYFLDEKYEIADVTDVARRTVGNISGLATAVEYSSYGTSVTSVDNKEQIEALDEKIKEMLKIAKIKPGEALIAENRVTFNEAVEERNRLAKEQGLQIITTPEYGELETVEGETVEGKKSKNPAPTQ